MSMLSHASYFDNDNKLSPLTNHNEYLEIQILSIKINICMKFKCLGHLSYLGNLLLWICFRRRAPSSSNERRALTSSFQELLGQS